jgi:hypothetical protein
MRTRRDTLLGAVLLTLLMLGSTVASPASATGMTGAMEGSADGQPDHTNNTAYIFGTTSGNPCWNNFNDTSDNSANTGYGEDEQNSGKLEVEWTCRMDPVLGDTMALEEGQDIRVTLFVDLQGTWENGQGNCQGDCENLNVSLMRGSVVSQTMEVAGLVEGQSTVTVNFPVDENITIWNKTSDSPGIRVRMVMYGDSGPLCVFFDCSSHFRLYYTHPAEGREDPDEGGNSTMVFPILNQTAADDILGGGNGGKKDAEEKGFLPGFGLLIGTGALAAAAVSGRTKPD